MLVLVYVYLFLVIIGLLWSCEYLAPRYEARTSLHSFRTSWPQAKYYPVRPPHSVNKYIIFHILSVSQACKGCLRSIAPLMGSESVNKMFQKHLLEEGHLHYGEFMNDLSRLLVSTVFWFLSNFMVKKTVFKLRQAYNTVDWCMSTSNKFLTLRLSAVVSQAWLFEYQILGSILHVKITDCVIPVQTYFIILLENISLGDR